MRQDPTPSHHGPSWLARGARALALAATVLVSAPALAAETVRIALIDPLSGAFAPVGQGMLKQFSYIVDLANNRQWAGKDIRFELTGLDGKGSPQESLTQLRQAIDQGVRYVVQGNSSAVGLALSDAIAKHNQRNPGKEVVYLNYAAIDPALTNEKCSFWHFRLDANADQKMEALTSFLRGQTSVRKVYLVNQNYAFGRAVAASAREMLGRKRNDVEIVGDELHAIGQIQDFAPFVARIRESGADTVITGNWGADLALLIKAAREARLPANFYTYYANATGMPTAMGSAGEDRVRYVGTWNPNERSFGGADLREDFGRRNGGDFSLKQAWDALRLLSDGIRKAQSTDPVKVAAAMETLSFASLAGPVEMRSADHQLQQALVIASWQKKDGKTVRFDDEKTGYGWRTESIQPAYVGVQPTSCVMARP